MHTLLEKSRAYKYNSFMYLNLEEIQMDATKDIIIDEPGVFMLGQFADDRIHILWGAESKSLLLKAVSEILMRLKDLQLDGLNRVYIEFVEADFVPDLEALGFIVVSEFMDF